MQGPAPYSYLRNFLLSGQHSQQVVQGGDMQFKAAALFIWVSRIDSILYSKYKIRCSPKEIAHESGTRLCILFDQAGRGIDFGTKYAT